MSKSNPLFVDSTLHQGDSIGTQIELSDVFVYEGETLYIVLVNHEGEEMYLPMEQVGDTNFEVFVRLVHQKAVSFYFGIEKNAELLWKSEVYERNARYALIEYWEPILRYLPNKLTGWVEEHGFALLDAPEEDYSAYMHIELPMLSTDVAPVSEVAVAQVDAPSPVLLLAAPPQSFTEALAQANEAEAPTTEFQLEPQSQAALHVAINESAKPQPILMPEDVKTITSLLNKWGFT